MAKLLRFLKLSWLEKALFFEAYFRLGFARLAVLVIPYNKLSRRFGIPMLESLPTVPDNRELLVKISWAVQSASKYTPWESNCLAQAIAAMKMLRSRGMTSTIYLGMAKGEKEDMGAHAWLRSGDTFVVGAGNSQEYTVVATYADVSTDTSPELK
jgi:hypothetical protein